MGVFNSYKNERKQFDLRYHSIKVDFFVHFLGELKRPKRHFEINWPLKWPKHAGAKAPIAPVLNTPLLGVSWGCLLRVYLEFDLGVLWDNLFGICWGLSALGQCLLLLFNTLKAWNNFRWSKPTWRKDWIQKSWVINKDFKSQFNRVLIQSEKKVDIQPQKINQVIYLGSHKF